MVALWCCPSYATEYSRAYVEERVTLPFTALATEMLSGFSIPLTAYLAVFMLLFLVMRATKCPWVGMSAILCACLLGTGVLLWPLGRNADPVMASHCFGVLWGGIFLLAVFLGLAIYVPQQEAKRRSASVDPQAQ